MTIQTIKPPSNGTDDQEKNNKGLNSLVLILSGIIVCLLLIISIMLYMPSSKDKIKTTERINVEIEKEKTIKGAFKEPLKEQFDEQSQIDWIIKKTEAEQLQMLIWSEEIYKKAISLADQAEESKQQKDVKQAEKLFNSATEILNKELENKEKKRDELINLAGKSFENGQLVKAKQQLEMAQLIDKHSKIIEDELQRIENRHKTNLLYDKAIEYKKNEKIDIAINSLEQALLIESDNLLIKKELEFLNNKKLKMEFNRVINATLQAIEKNDLTKASQQLEVAQKLKAADPIVNELNIRIKEQIKNQIIERLQKEAENQQVNEQWNKALKSYLTILQYDEYANNAKLNKQRVQLYIDVNKMLDSIILKPERLQNEQVLKESKESLVYIKDEFKQAGNLFYPLEKTPSLSKKISTAERLIKAASIKVPVTILSDNETNIVIYKVGKFGQLSKKNITLRPGIYTVVGSRTGYRDFRKQIQISSTNQSVTINVQCKEKI